jgi:hypothetical protein
VSLLLSLARDFLKRKETHFDRRELPIQGDADQQRAGIGERPQNGPSDLELFRRDLLIIGAASLATPSVAATAVPPAAKAQAAGSIFSTDIAAIDLATTEDLGSATAWD